mmetsp:Transcript_2301/g.5548  ORF Transcript_2301/g.5548 Transcript_2301/m.5548 type:complete len:94 (-) Transcript_2301:4135-4416(-)
MLVPGTRYGKAIISEEKYQSLYYQKRCARRLISDTSSNHKQYIRRNFSLVAKLYHPTSIFCTFLQISFHVTMASLDQIVLETLSPNSEIRNKG